MINKIFIYIFFVFIAIAFLLLSAAFFLYIYSQIGFYHTPANYASWGFCILAYAVISLIILAYLDII